jgi:glucans biosynthesis protein
MSDHARNTGPMHAAPRCGAKTRSGKSCMSPAARGKNRCRMHGGGAGTGAPKGNRNAFRTGLHTRDAVADRKALNALIRQSQKLLAALDD